MRHSVSIGVSFLFFLGASSTYGQFTPVTAAIKQTEEWSVDGKVTKTVVQEGTYWRTSAGSTLVRWSKLNGDPGAASVAWGDLWDNSTAISYRIDFKYGKAYEHNKGHGPVQAGSFRTNETLSAPEDFVDGARCRVLPVKMELSGQLQEVGKFCISLEYDMVLRQEITHPLRTQGQTFHKVVEISGVRAGAEPDPKMFDLQHTYSLLQETNKRD